MARITYKPYNQGQGVLFPVSYDSKIPEDHPVRLISQIVDELDLTGINFGYKGGANSSYHPRMLLKVLFYAYLKTLSAGFLPNLEYRKIMIIKKRE